MTDITEVADCGEFSALDTREEVLGFLIACARSEGFDEVEAVKTAVTAAGMSRAELRRVRDTLRRLGYAKVSTMLTELAKKTKR
jgi:hypothetical protein